jgi:hypothetical protein
MAITTNGTAGTVLSVSNDLALAISDESGTGAVVFNTSPTLVTPTLGTASATAIELGHATDTTIARASAGVITVEGVAVPTISSTSTLTNKTISGASNTLTVRLDNTDVTGTLVATKGGTAQSTYTTGDILYASASNTLSKLAVGTTGQVLTIAGGVPTYATPSAGTTANDQAFAFAVQVFA